VPGLEVAVYFLFGCQPLHTHFPGPKPARAGIGLHLGVGPSAVLGGFSHGDQLGDFGFFGHALTPWPPVPISGEGEKVCIWGCSTPRW
jgi:hypothetical protein